MRSLFAIMLFWHGVAFAQTPAEKAATLKYLASLQEANGSYRSDAEGGPSLRATSAAVRAIKYLGGQPPRLDATRKFVLARYDAESGGFAEAGELPSVLVTSIGLMAASELDIPEKQIPKAIEYLKANVKTFEDVRIGAAALEAMKQKPAWLESWMTIANNQLNNDGTAGKGDGLARDTGSVIAMKLRLGYPVANKNKVIAAIKAGQKADGGWGKAGAKTSDLDSTYRVMRALMLAKETPADSAKLKQFLASCRNANGGYGSTPGVPSSAAGTYYFASISKWLK